MQSSLPSRLTILITILLTTALSVFAQPLTGYKTIGGTAPNYATFNAAITALNTNGVGAGGVTFLVRPGIYSELVSIPFVATASASNPITFRNDSTQVGTVQISPNVTSTGLYGIRLFGAQYVTLLNLSIIDTSTGTTPLYYGIFTTNSSGTAGAQHNLVKNCTIRLRISNYLSYGVVQTSTYTITAATGAQSDNHYLNLKISKTRVGFYNNANTTYPDIGTELGSDSSGVNYSKRFTIGAMANDTIGGAAQAYGIYFNVTAGVNIHDVDVTNLLTYSSNFAINGIYIGNVVVNNTPNTIRNCRVYNLNTTFPNFYTSVYGINFNNPSAFPFKIYNNLIYGLHSNATNAAASTGLLVYGIYATNGNADIDHNTIMIDDGGYATCRNYVSIALYASGGYDTIRNNILTNYTGNATNGAAHIALYLNNLTSFWSNNNCFYIPNTTLNGVVGQMGTSSRYHTLASWQTAAGTPDLNSTYGDPQFVSTVAPIDLHIQSNMRTSPVDQRGDSSSVTAPAYVTSDFDGNPRSTPADIGAFEGHFKQLSGSYTIGGSFPDYSNFASVTRDIANCGIGTGGATFLIRPGIYSESLSIPYGAGMSASNPVLFRKDPLEVGTVQFSPSTTGINSYAIRLYGCQYVTVENISIVDTTTGTYAVAYGVFTTNSSATQGAQHNWVKNCDIRMRSVISTTVGIMQSGQTAISSTTGAQSDNHYINLRISRAGYGVYSYADPSYPDAGLEIGSDIVGTNYANRFAIGTGVNDTIGGFGFGTGIYTNFTYGINIHDVDIANVYVTTGSVSSNGISINSQASAALPNTIANCRVYGIHASRTTSFNSVYGINVSSGVTRPTRIYNNLVYDLQSIAPSANATSTYIVHGIYVLGGGASIDHNTVVIDDGGVVSSRNYSSAAITTAAGTDTIRNNIVANYTYMGGNTSYHVAFYRNGSTIWADNNSIYVPNSSSTGYIGQNITPLYSTLAAWRAVGSTDMNSNYGDPHFTSVVSPYDLTILPDQSVSPVDHYGMAFGAMSPNYITTDINGNPRTAPADIGCSEGDYLLMGGTYTIYSGSGFPNYPSFTAAIDEMSRVGIATGGVTFNVATGTYIENIVVPYITGMGASSPVSFIRQSGAVEVRPPVTAPNQHGIKLQGCQYVTFDGIDVIDVSTGATPLQSCYTITNSSGSVGSQHNTIRNAIIRGRVNLSGAYGVTYGVYQYSTLTPLSAAGVQSYNRYLNLKISKVTKGVSINSYSLNPDIGTEIGSDNYGLTNPNRFTIGGMVGDTIGYTSSATGIVVNSTSSIHIHDVDISNVYGVSGYGAGIYLYNPSYGAGSSTTMVYNNRIFDIFANSSTLITNGYGIFTNLSNTDCRIYNNMIYNVQQIAPMPVTSNYHIFGIYNNNYNPGSIVNNTIWLNQIGTQNFSSACVRLTTTGVDTLKNNIFANTGLQAAAAPYHVGIQVSNGTTQPISDNNCFYIPNALGGHIGTFNNVYWPTLASWQSSRTPAFDMNSVVGNPVFMNDASAPYDLHILLHQPTPSIIDNRGEALGWMTTDIDGEPRTTLPDIGADQGDFYSVPSGYKTIGGYNPDYPTFASAISALRTYGVGNGGVTFLVRPQVYSESFSVPPFPNMGANNPVTFRNDTTFGGSPQISPAVTGTYQYGIRLMGCQYVTFHGIDIIDTTTGTYPLMIGYSITNNSSMEGSQHITIRNATVRLRIAPGIVNGYSTTAINQGWSYTPAALAGTQSYNRYLNMKISKVTTGVLIAGSASIPDVGTEIGSDNVGASYADRFVIGAMANDTIGGYVSGYGVYVNSAAGVKIHDVDITKMKALTSSVSLTGIRLLGAVGVAGSEPALVYNNRVYGFAGLVPSSYTTILGIDVNHNHLNGLCRIYNNQIYDLQQTSTIAATTSTYFIYGVRYSSSAATLVGNTIVLNQTGTQTYSSACVYVSPVVSPDTIQNNIFVNSGYQTSIVPKHVAIYDALTFNTSALVWNNNCFYIPNATGGNIGSHAGTYYPLLSTWRTSNTPNIDGNSVQGNPNFVSVNSPYDFHVQTNPMYPSITESAGIPHSWITTDFDGESRGAIPDIGADEGIFRRAIMFTLPGDFSPLTFGVTDTITWSSIVSGTANIQLNRDYPTGTWETITSTVDLSEGRFLWTPTPPFSNNARFAIYSNENPTTGDTSGVFAIASYPNLYQSASSLNFDRTYVHSVDSTMIVIADRCNQPFRYYTLTGANSSMFSHRVLNSDTLTNSNDSLRIMVYFHPDGLTTYRDTLRLTFPWPYTTITIPLAGTGTGCNVTLPGSSLNFGYNAQPNQSTSLDLPVLVTGTHSLDNARWITIPSDAPFTVMPNPMPSIPENTTYTARAFFTPSTSGNFSATLGLISNALNGDTLLIAVSGFAMATPVAPGLSITINNDNAVLSWTRPDTTVQRYLIYFRNSPSLPWQFYANTIGANATSYTHPGVVRFSPQMYYQVTAWYGGASTDSFDEIIRTIPIGTPEDVVRKKLQQIYPQKR